ncbi:hypothetical protein Tco_1199032 [Tanacetum coccineum]
MNAYKKKTGCGLERHSLGLDYGQSARDDDSNSDHEQIFNIESLGRPLQEKPPIVTEQFSSLTILKFVTKSISDQNQVTSRHYSSVTKTIRDET